MATVRICVCGDEATGKSSLITSLVKDVFVTNKIQPVLPTITLPPTLGTPDNVTTVIVDTSALPHERTNLRKEIRKSNVILLVYSDHYSYERVALFWLPYFRSQGVNVPVVLCANKSDLASNGNTSSVIEDEMLPVMAEFKEIDSCIRTSAREHTNVNEAFFLCQKAVTHPIAPLFDAKEMTLKPAAITALKRVFYLCDKDQDGFLNDDEIRAFQLRVFEKSLSDEDLANIKRSVQQHQPPTDAEEENLPSLDLDAFIRLNSLFIHKGRHETLWMILRKYNYNDSLTLSPSYVSPKLDIPPNCSAELSPTGYRFFVDLFLTFDKDNDGGLSTTELTALLAPTPGLPQLWLDSDFPSCTVVNDAGAVTLQGWLSQWSMTTFESPHTTLAYLAYLGFETPSKGGTTTAIHITPPRSKRRRLRPATKHQQPTTPKLDRTVYLAYILGAPHAGKSTLLHAFLSKPYDTTQTYHPTLQPRVAVNSVELPGGKQCHLILRELGAHAPAILENSAKLSSADLIAYAYDSSDAHSWAAIPALRAKHAYLEALPSVFVATKADGDKAVQNADVQPEVYTAGLGLREPTHVSARWESIGELFVGLAEAAAWPESVLPRRDDEDDGEGVGVYVAAGAVVAAVAAVLVVWKRNGWMMFGG